MRKETFKFFHPFWLILLGISLIQADEIDTTLDLLKQGDRNILTKPFHEAVLVFGENGSGKTVLTKFISDFDEQLFSEKNGGSFIIKDETDLGSRDNLVADNTFTELLIDETTDVPYYNCPAFTYSVDAKSDIASAYFTYKAIQSIESVKIVFVVDNVEKIDEVTQYASKFINIKFKNSVALIITKARNDAVKEQASNKLKSIKSTTKNKNEKKLANALLQNIGVFKVPTKKGKLSTLPDMVQNKNDLKALISNMGYAKMNLTNFDYKFLHDKWSQQINQIFDRINTLKSNEVNRKVEEYFKGEEGRFYDFQLFRAQIEQRLERMKEIIASLKEMTDPFDLEKQVLKYLYEIIVEIPKELSLYADISDFLTVTNTQQLTAKSNEWINQLQSTVVYLENLRNVFKLFDVIYESITINWLQFKIWIYGNMTKNSFTARRIKGETIKGSDLNEFKTQVYGGSTERNEHFEKIQEIPLNDIELGILYQIFEEANIDEHKVKCTDDELTVTGNYVSMSDVVNGQCDRKKVSIFAFNTFYNTYSKFDVDHDQGEISIISPNWIINTYTKLNVGKKRTDPNADNYGGAIMAIGGLFKEGSSFHMNSNGGDIYTFGPLYDKSPTSERPCGFLDEKYFENPSETKKMCEKSHEVLIQGEHAHRFPDKGHVLISYKDAIIKNLQNRYQRNESLTFLLEINKIDLIYMLYTVPDFVEELTILEKHYQTFKNKELLKPLYENILKWVAERIERTKGSAPTELVDLKIIYRYLYSVTLAKIIAINSNAHNSFVVDIDVYLDYILYNIGRLEHRDMQTAVDNTKAKYQEQLDHKIEEGNKFIQNHIMPRIEQVQGHIISVTEVDFIKEIKEVEITVKEQMKEIKAKMWQVAIAGILGFVGTILTIFGGPVGIAVGTMMNVGSAVVGSLNVGDKSTKMHQVPADLESKLASVNKFCDDYEQEREEVYSATMKYLAGQVDDQAVKDAYTKAVEVKAINPDDRLKLTHAILDDHIKKVKAQNPKSAALGKFKAAKSFANVAEVGTKAFLQVKDDVEKISSLSDLLEEKKKELENLKKLRATVSENLVPLLKNMSKELNEKLNGLRTESRISLDVQKWRIKEALSDLRLQLQSLTNGFQVQGEILTYVSKLGEAVEVVIAIYDRMQSYEEHKKFSDYIFDITHPQVDFTEVIQDPDLKKAKDTMDLMLQRNVLMQNYQNAISGLKQHVFPFAQIYLERNQVDFKWNDNENIADTAKAVGVHINKLKAQLKLFKSTIMSDYQKYIQTYSFYSYRTYHPFFIWRNEDYGAIIKSLMSGEQVILRADITSSTKNAVKFNKIDLQFKSYNSDIQNSINNLLIDYELNMTHMGNSYYKCDDKIFVVPSQSLTINYGFAMKDGKVRTENQVNQMLKDSYFMLSPYAMWTIQLKSNRPDGFAQLSKYSNTVSLELSGDGQYVSDTAPVCKTDLESYYELDSTYYMRKNNLLE